jgi:hypothetical protein
MPEPEPKCTRLIVTAVFADGTSTMVDVPEPADATMNFNRLPDPLPLDFYIMALVPETTPRHRRSHDPAQRAGLGAA